MLKLSQSLTYKSWLIVFYIPMHVVYKASSTTTTVRAVFCASAKSSSRVLFNSM